MNKLTKILIIVAITGLILGTMTESPLIGISTAVLCGAAYLISKVLASGPRPSYGTPEIPLGFQFTGTDEELMKLITESKGVIAHLETGLRGAADAERPAIETALATARRYLQCLELECERRARDYTTGTHWAHK